MTPVSLTPLDLAIAAVLMLVTATISAAFRLGLEKSLAISAARMCVQLAAVGFILKLVLESGSIAYTALFAAVMLIATGYEAGTQLDRKFLGAASYVLGGAAPFLAGLLATIFAVTMVIGTEPWYAPRYFLPLLGMTIGNALAGAILVLDTMTGSVTRERAALEARLALGATRFEALSDILGRGLKAGLTPILTAMAMSGIVSLPGLMTGQILAGVDPIEAAKYQIVILFLIAGATGIAVVLAGFGAVILLTDDRHRLRLDRLRGERNSRR